MNAKLCLINVPFADKGKMEKFYFELLGIQFARSFTNKVNSDHIPITRDGIFLTVTNRKSDREPVVCYFGVKNLKKSIEDLKKAGGKMLAGPFELPIASELQNEYKAAKKRLRCKETITNTIGNAAIIQDPEGNPVGLIQLEGHAHDTFKVGRYYTPVTQLQLKRHRNALLKGKLLGADKPEKPVAGTKKSPGAKK